MQWLEITVLSRAFSTSLAKPRRTSEITYSMDAASQGIVIGPSLDSPNRSSDNLSISWKRPLQRNHKGTSKRPWSVVYTTKWPLSARSRWCFDFGSVSGKETLLLPEVALCCHFLAILTSFFGLTIVESLTDREMSSLILSSENGMFGWWKPAETVLFIYPWTRMDSFWYVDVS